MFGYGMFFDDYGNAIKRTKLTNPWDYETFVLWDDGSGIGDPQKRVKGLSTQYSDRMFQHDFELFNKCSQAVFGNRGQYFGNRSPEDIQEFLKLYFNIPALRLVRILEGCNVSSGYSVWAFKFIDMAKAVPTESKESYKIQEIANGAYKN